MRRLDGWPAARLASGEVQGGAEIPREEPQPEGGGVGLVAGEPRPLYDIPPVACVFGEELVVAAEGKVCGYELEGLVSLSRSESDAGPIAFPSWTVRLPGVRALCPIPPRRGVSRGRPCDNRAACGVDDAEHPGRGLYALCSGDTALFAVWPSSGEVRPLMDAPSRSSVGPVGGALCTAGGRVYFSYSPESTCFCAPEPEPGAGRVRFSALRQLGQGVPYLSEDGSLLALSCPGSVALLAPGVSGASGASGSVMKRWKATRRVFLHGGFGRTVLAADESSLASFDVVTGRAETLCHGRTKLEYDGAVYACEGALQCGGSVIAHLRSVEACRTVVLLGGVRDVCDEFRRASGSGNATDGGVGIHAASSAAPGPFVSAEEALRACRAGRWLRGLAQRLVSAGDGAVAVRGAQACVSNLIRARAESVSGRFIGTPQERLRLCRDLESAMFASVEGMLARERRRALGWMDWMAGESGGQGGQGEPGESEQSGSQRDPAPSQRDPPSRRSPHEPPDPHDPHNGAPSDSSDASADSSPAGSLLHSRGAHNFVSLPPRKPSDASPGHVAITVTLPGSYALLRADICGNAYLLLVGRERVCAFPV